MTTNNAPKLWLYLVTEGARWYKKEHGLAIDKETREHVAHELARAFEAEREIQRSAAARAMVSELAIDASAVEHDEEFLLGLGEPFCACGRRLSDCDGSRKRCHRETQRKAAAS